MSVSEQKSAGAKTVFDRKIVTLSQLRHLLHPNKRGGKVVLCHGVFDLLHPGHIQHLKAARRLGDRLVVTLTPDRYVNKGPGRPVFGERHRLETLAELECVDYVALNEWPTAIETIRAIKPDIYVKGREYEKYAADITGNISLEADAVREAGGEIKFTHEETFSSSHLINRYFCPYPEEADIFLREFRKRRGSDEIISALKSLADLRVLVVGEAILDQYCYCSAVGKSPKDMLVATKFLSEEQFAGGALATANHLAGFCREVTLLTMIGKSEAERKFIQSKLLPNVNLVPVRLTDRPTVTKRRYVDPTFMTKLFEIQYLDDSPLAGVQEQEVIRLLNQRRQDCDLVVVNDFGHGFLTDAIRQKICGDSKFLAVNAQSNSANMGFNPVTKYQRADYVSIDDPELRLAAGTRHGSVHILASNLKRRLKAKYFTVSLGPKGCVVLKGQKQLVSVPVMSTRIVDRTGAGDALFAVTAPCAYREMDPDVIGFIGNCVGAMAVETVCNREPVSPTRLHKFIDALLK